MSEERKRRLDTLPGAPRPTRTFPRATCECSQTGCCRWAARRRGGEAASRTGRALRGIVSTVKPAWNRAPVGTAPRTSDHGAGASSCSGQLTAGCSLRERAGARQRAVCKFSGALHFQAQGDLTGRAWLPCPPGSAPGCIAQPRLRKGGPSAGRAGASRAQPDRPAPTWSTPAPLRRTGSRDGSAPSAAHCSGNQTLFAETRSWRP